MASLRSVASYPTRRSGWSERENLRSSEDGFYRFAWPSRWSEEGVSTDLREDSVSI